MSTSKKRWRPREGDVQTACLQLLKVLQVVHWRVNSGCAWLPTGKSGDGRERPVKFVGVDGHADIFAMIPLRLQKWEGELVRIAHACFIEVKRPGEVQTEKQRDFQALVEGVGAVYFVVHSVDELVEGLRARGVAC